MPVRSILSKNRRNRSYPREFLAVWIFFRKMFTSLGCEPHEQKYEAIKSTASIQNCCFTNRKFETRVLKRLFCYKLWILKAILSEFARIVLKISKRSFRLETTYLYAVGIFRRSFQLSGTSLWLQPWWPDTVESPADRNFKIGVWQRQFETDAVEKI